MIQDLPPEHVRRLCAKEAFSFRCHPGLLCFTDCCRQLELALTPYDVLRLKNNLGLTADDFLEQYCLIERHEDEPFPKVFLGMNNDEQGTCPFVEKSGCKVYDDRPGACRAYPVGRAAFQTTDGKFHDFHVLLTEPHCQGFSESASQSVAQWTKAQGLDEYNTMNDETMVILHHQNAQTQQFSKEQLDAFMLALYRLDAFRKYVLAPENKRKADLTPEEQEKIAVDDKALLLFSIRWLKNELYGEQQ